MKTKIILDINEKNIIRNFATGSSINRESDLINYIEELINLAVKFHTNITTKGK
jgi:hypothetical protein